jgi:polysaccharide biosynthesis/export protein
MRRLSFRFLGRLYLLLVVVFAAVSTVGLTAAQDDPTPSADLLKAIQGQRGEDVRGPKSTVQVLAPVPAPDSSSEPTSRLENLYAARAGGTDKRIRQFGYNLLGVPGSATVNLMGALQDQYILGEGDEVVIQLRGQENSDFRARVDRDGQIVLPKLSPVSAAGRTLGAVRTDIAAAVARAYVSTNAFVTIGQVRQISVLVTGEVRAPGVRMMSALSSPLDALLISGGVAKTGSLRAIQLIRDGTVKTIDLYGLLTRGALSSLGTLQNGDKIFVPPIGATVGVIGEIKHEGIFELARGTGSIRVGDLVRLAGGVELSGSIRYSKLTMDAGGKVMRQVEVTENSVVANGETLFVYLFNSAAEDRVTLAGAVRTPGFRAFASFRTLGQLVHGISELNDDAYTLLTVISRRDRASNTRTLLPVSLYRVLKGETDVPLKGDDVVYILTNDEVRAIAKFAVTGSNQTSNSYTHSSESSPDLVRPGELTGDTAGASTPGSPNSSAALVPSSATPGPAPGTTAGIAPSTLARVARLTNRPVAPDRSGKVSNVGGSAGGGDTDQPIPAVSGIADTLNVSPDVVLRTLASHLVWVLGEVGDARAYLAAPGTRLGDMLDVAGGPLRDSDLSAIEVTSTSFDTKTGDSHTSRVMASQSSGDFTTVSIEPFDVIRVRPIFTERREGHVTVLGAVRYPGTFDVLRNERLSSLISRAGGLSSEAYPYGAIFTRISVAEAERKAHEREAQELNSQLATLVSSSLRPLPGTSNNSGSSENAVQLMASLADQLRSTPAIGRMSVIADPAVLAVDPANDILLEPGDTIYIPPRPSTVSVSGEVLSPGTFLYDPKLTAADYVRLAGGSTQSADDSRTFVLLPDGTAEPVSDGWVSFNHRTIPPGATIIVPRDLAPFNLGVFLANVSQIISQLSISAASIAVISRQN